MKTPLQATYSSIQLAEHPSLTDLARLSEPYQAMIATQFRAIIERTEASPVYPWLDTKIDLNTGRDYPADDPLFGRDLVSGWVQGRGLEAITGFASWLGAWAGDEEVDALVLRCRRLAAALLEQLSQARALNGGHTYFFMSSEGRAFVFGAGGRRDYLPLAPETPYNYSDLFSAKGMYAAACYLADGPAIAAARAYCLAVYEDILSFRFTSDQPVPRGIVAKPWVPGALAHGPFMIGQSMAALFASHEPGSESAGMGLRLARRMWDAHVNLRGRWPDLRNLDMVEYVDAVGRPYVDEGGRRHRHRIISDPGHSLEGAGLFLKLWDAVQGAGGATPEQVRHYAEIAALMPAFLIHNFENGFRPKLGGIAKTIDLLTRRPVDGTMPWWSLPETIRASLECARITHDDVERGRCLEIAAATHNAFVENYVRPSSYLMAVKLRDARGRVSHLVPAYPDADPGYHTALSLVDALRCIPSIIL